MINEELVETTYNQDSPASLLLLLMTGEPELVSSSGLETRIAAAIEAVKAKKNFLSKNFFKISNCFCIVIMIT